MMRLANLLAWLTVAVVIVGCDSSGDSTTATTTTQAGTESTSTETTQTNDGTASEDTALSEWAIDARTRSSVPCGADGTGPGGTLELRSAPDLS